MKKINWNDFRLTGTIKHLIINSDQKEIIKLEIDKSLYYENKEFFETYINNMLNNLLITIKYTGSKEKIKEELFNKIFFN